MTMSYESFAPLSPPRPEKAVPPSMLARYERMGFVLQAKKNGTYTVVYVSPDKEVTALNRHQEPHKAWAWSSFTKAPFAELPGRGWWVICAELLHSKVAGLRDTHYVHDVLVADGDYLLDETYAQRYARLQSLFLPRAESDTPDHWVCPNNVWLAKNKKSDFKAFYESLTAPEDEGVVLKDPRAVLTVRPGHWSVKCRRPQKNFSF